MIEHLKDLTQDPENRRKRTPKNLGMIADSLQEVGAARSIVIDEDGVILAGNGVWEAAGQVGIEKVRVVEADGNEVIAVRRTGLTPDQKRRLGLWDNAAALAAEWDPAQILRDVEAGLGFDGIFGEDEIAALVAQSLAPPEAEPTTPEEARRTLAERFGVPPFSVLDARQGYWQERKRAWLGSGIQSELGRGDAPMGAYPVTGSAAGVTRSLHVASAARATGLLGESQQAEDATIRRGGVGFDGSKVIGKGTARTEGSGNPGDLGTKYRAEAGRQVTATPYGAIGAEDDTSRRIAAATPRGPARAQEPLLASGDHGSHVQAPEQASGTSIFDPVLCELVYRWFSPADAQIIDPFAGGSVRGIVASRLGRAYTGIDLSERQLEANREQAAAIVPDALPTWIVGDSRNAAALAPGDYDLIFSCPPYADLERYSDDPADLSTMDYAAFLAAYRQIVAACVGMLKEDRFAVFTVGDVRDGRGFYRNFVGDTVAAFQDAGATLYNEAILVTAVGSLPIRVGKQFGSYRKLGKTHQQLLCFYKGDPRRIPEVLTGDCEFGDLSNYEGEEAV